MKSKNIISQEPKFTKGEWKVDEDGFGYRIISDQTNPDDTVDIAEIDSYFENPDEIKANANLISAAPDMYQLLKGLINDPNHFCLLPPHYKQAISNILAKAEGKA